MRKSRSFVISGIGAACLFAALALTAMALPARAAEDGASAKAVLGKWQDAVITVKATVKIRVALGGNEQTKEENEVETLATIVDPSGLAVLSFSCIDPTKVFDGLMKSAGSGSPQVDINSEITDMDMVMPDGREIPAKVVLRDGDLDMAFIKPVDKLEKPLACIDLTSESKADVLDTICIISRLDKVAGRSPSITMNRIEAVITSPRRCYVVENSTLMNRLGAPVFSLDGKVVGFSLLRISKSYDKSRMGGFMSRGMDSLGIMPVVLPVAEVAAEAKQAMEIKDE